MGFIGKQPAKAAITSSDITDGVVTADKLASNAVTTAKINADAVTDAKIADDVVGSEHLTAGEVDTTALGADAVTAAKIADDAISDEHLDTTAITGHAAETSIADDDLILISDTSASAALKKMTRSNFVSGVGGTNTPSFSAYMGSAQTISSGTHTKLEFQTESFDTDGTFDHSTNYRWTPGAVGKFLVTAYARIQASTDEVWIQLRKNGSTFMTMADTRPNAEWLTGGARVLNHTNSSDYYEIWAYQSSGGNITSGSGIENSEFSAFKLIT